MKKSKSTALALNGYAEFLGELKQRIMSARLSAARAVNSELILLYWDIGRGIVEKQQTLGWGESVVEMVAADLQRAFPSMSGFSPRNLRDMKRFFLAYSDRAIWPQAVAKLEAHDDPTAIPRQPAAKSEAGRIWPQAVAKLKTSGHSTQFLQQLVAEVPWGHHRFILDKLSDPAARFYSLQATAQFGWSRNVLLNQIKAKAYERAKLEKKTHNFALALPEDLAEQALKLGI